MAAEPEPKRLTDLGPIVERHLQERESSKILPQPIQPTGLITEPPRQPFPSFEYLLSEEDRKMLEQKESETLRILQGFGVLEKLTWIHENIWKGWASKEWRRRTGEAQPGIYCFKNSHYNFYEADKVGKIEVARYIISDTKRGDPRYKWHRRGDVNLDDVYQNPFRYISDLDETGASLTGPASWDESTGMNLELKSWPMGYALYNTVEIAGKRIGRSYGYSSGGGYWQYDGPWRSSYVSTKTSGVMPGNRTPDRLDTDAVICRVIPIPNPNKGGVETSFDNDLVLAVGVYSGWPKNLLPDLREPEEFNPILKKPSSLVFGGYFGSFDQEPKLAEALADCSVKLGSEIPHPATKIPNSI